MQDPAQPFTHALTRPEYRPPSPGGRGAERLRALAAFALLTTFSALVSPSPAFAGDVHSNGTGGGRWSDPTAWHAQTPPTANDTVIISRGDTIAFDRDDGGKTSCKDLLLDPGATLAFKPGSGRMTLVVAGVVESYGAIRIDTSQQPTDFAEMRLVGPELPKRLIKLYKGSSLIVSGAENLAGKRKNLMIASAPPLPVSPEAAPGKPAPPPPPVGDVTGAIEAAEGTMVDLRQADLSGMVLKINNIDNTGAKPAERANFAGCRFVNLSRLLMSACDTPKLADCLFLFEGKGQNPNPAASFSGCPLADIRGNTFKGNYERALSGGSQVDATILGNVFDTNHYGIVWDGPNAMIKSNLFRDCDYAMSVTIAGAAIEDVVIDNPKILGISAGGASTLQMVNVKATNLAKDIMVLDLANAAQAQLLNCAVPPERIHVPAKVSRRDAANKPEHWAEGQAYVFVNVKGTLPAGAEVEILTANPPAPLPPGAPDLNIRNSPAKITRGWTPPPRSPDCMVVRTWRIGSEGTPEPTPAYTLRVLGPYPNAKPDAVQPVLKTMPITPADAWYRAKPDDAAPTLEVAVP
ncbi:MAG: hypothetical protein NTW19_07245 [Planctomycetota bacterium]|nr:hypothetical protein [Planctomycetota bacterium]